MASEINRRVVLVQRPSGMPKASDFRVEEEPLAPLEEGQVRIDVSHLSIDAFIRTALEEVAYHTPNSIGGTILVLGVGYVRESRSSRFSIGDAVSAPLGAQTIATLPDVMLQPIDEQHAPITAHLGILGMTTGLTAYFGIREVGQVKPGDTVVVSAAAGAVGSLAGQIARIDGARVIGIAGGTDKCRYLTETLGFHAAVDYKGQDVDTRLRELAPEGIDVYFDNVGGSMLDIVLDQIREQARIVICGAISQYQGDMSKGVRGPSLYLRLAERHARMEGFAVTHFGSQFDEGRAVLAEWLASDALVLSEHVETGIENFGSTLKLLFEGGNTGKLLLAV